MSHLTTQKIECLYLHNITIMERIWRKQSKISPLKWYKEKITTNSKYDVEGSCIMKTYRENVMYAFYMDVSKFSGSLEGVFDEGVYKNKIK